MNLISFRTLKKFRELCFYTVFSAVNFFRAYRRKKSEKLESWLFSGLGVDFWAVRCYNISENVGQHGQHPGGHNMAENNKSVKGSIIYTAKKILRFIKKAIYKVCGKARWLMAVFVLSCTAMMMISFNVYLGSLSMTDNDSAPITEVSLEDITEFSVNTNGTAAVSCNIGKNSGYTTVLDLETQAHSYANTDVLPLNILKDDYFIPSNYAYTDDNVLYAVRTHFDKEMSDDIIMKESIVLISDKYRYTGTVCEIPYDDTEPTRSSKLSRLHYYSGAVTFACVEKGKTQLYSIDTETNSLRISREYNTEADGTSTMNVIPVDGAFLFIRSDGSVILTGFDEPLENGDIIYHFDNTSAAPYLTQAVISDGTLYAFDDNDPGKLFSIADGKAETILDLKGTSGHKDSTIRYIGSYRPEGSDNEILAVCLSDGLVTVTDGEIRDKDITIGLDVDYPLAIIELILGILFEFALFGLIINLIIRKKTLLYKQIMATVPVFAIMTIVIAVRLYGYFEEQNNQMIRNSAEMICEFGTKELEGYDFSGLLDIGEDTGKEYIKLCDVLDDINTGHDGNSNNDYVLSVVYRTGDTKAAVIAKNDGITMPMCSETLINSEEDFKKYDSTGNFYAAEKIHKFFSFDARKSEIVAFGRISDRSGSGDIYLKVSTASKSFWYQRRELVLAIIGYSLLVIGLLVMTILLTSLYITRAIRQATGAVKKISDGDLSARINYRSKDELGEICTQVNAMGKSLETLFDEKDKTERFYYKFVPEQFRKLLGKDNFTDLALGDSSSRELTVLFCDIRSFSINSEIMTAKENFEFVNIIYGIAGPIIRENGGFVDKYIGDAVMALFENPDDAVRSGIEIYRAIVLDPDTAERLGISDINIGIGIHSGMAQIGIVGESERLSGTVISDTVNLSSRLESLTKQYKTAMLISKDTVDRMTDPDSLDLRYLGIVQVAGVNEVKAIYEVLDCLPESERTKRHNNSRCLREAIRLFHLGRRSETADMLREITDSGEGDHVTGMYLDFVKDLSPDDKGNVFRFVRK